MVVGKLSPKPSSFDQARKFWWIVSHPSACRTVAGPGGSGVPMASES